MRRFDRLLKALVPYSGLFMLGPCSVVPECVDDESTKTMSMTAAVEGDIALDTLFEPSIETTLVRSERPAADPEWRCEARVSANAIRQRDDTSSKPLPASVAIFCARGDGSITTKQLSLGMPLDDLRREAFPTDVRGTMTVSVQEQGGGATATCTGRQPVHVTTVMGESAGTEAAPPKFVTPDFVRAFTMSFAFEETSDTACGKMTGTITLDVRLDASSFVETTLQSCE